MDESEKMLEVTEPTESEETTSTQEQESDESETKEVEEVKTEKKVQTPEENSKYAQERRRKAELDNKVQEAYKKGRLEAYKGKINPYTNSEINDEVDIKVYEAMYDLDKQGKDPVADYANYIADKERELEKERLKQEELQENARKDIAEFSEKYPNLKNQFRTNAIDVAKQTIANANATPGSLGSGSEMEVNYESMSSEEFEKVIQGVIDGDIK